VLRAYVSLSRGKAAQQVVLTRDCRHAVFDIPTDPSPLMR
jgi:hypothetical protein